MSFKLNILPFNNPAYLAPFSMYHVLWTANIATGQGFVSFLIQLFSKLLYKITLKNLSSLTGMFKWCVPS